MKSRIVSCDHNGPDDIDMVKEIANRMPKGWTGLIVPDEGHPVAILPEELSDEEVAVLSSDAMVMIALQVALHNDSFAETIITNILGDEVERSDPARMH